MCKIQWTLFPVLWYFYLLELTLKTQVSNTYQFKRKNLLLLLLLLQLMFKVPSISTHAGSQTSTPLIHCRTDDVVMQVAPLLYHLLLQVVDVTNSWAVDTLLQPAPASRLDWGPDYSKATATARWNPAFHGSTSQQFHGPVNWQCWTRPFSTIFL